jgi:16S rRNA (cytidine1402-2'-O)-methyltransferase
MTNAPARYVIGAQTFDAPRLAAGLYVVATPIGNLGDMTIRALATLAAADAVLCEDTRVTPKLLERYAIRNKLISYHEHNAARLQSELIERLKAGEALALVSDAGMPLISDPGQRLVKACAEAGVAVTAIPGASAVLSALALSGLASEPFTFIGFLPSKASERKRLLEQFMASPATLVCFESPNRIAAALAAVAAFSPGRQVAVTRELTKLHEEVVRGSAADVAGQLAARETIKGEITLVISPPSPSENAVSDEEVEDAITAALAILPASQAATQVARSFRLSKKDIYARILARKG